MVIDKHGNKNLYGAHFGGFAYMIMIFSYMLISFVGGTVLNALDGEKDNIYYIVSSLFSVTAMALTILFFNFKRREKISLTIYAKKFRPIFIPLALILAVGMFFGFGFINTVIADLVIKMGGHISGIELPLESTGNYILFLFFFAVLPAFEEEAFFRGLLYENLERTKTVKTVLTIALAFALYHGSVNQFAYQFIYGIGLTLLAVKAGSAVPSFIAHFLNNFAILTCEHFNIEIDLFNPYLIAGGMVLLAVFFYLTVKVDGKNNIYKISEKGYRLRDFWLPYGIAGGAICLLLIILGAFV